MKGLIIALSLLLLGSCASSKSTAPDVDFARALAIQALNCDLRDWDQIDRQITSLGPEDSAQLKSLLRELLVQDPPLTTSIAGTWLIYKMIYRIDDINETLDYTETVEGSFNWERASSLAGTTLLDFVTEGGRQIAIFTTVATVDRDSAYEHSRGRKVRLYIKSEILADGSKRNQVVKIEPVY